MAIKVHIDKFDNFHFVFSTAWNRYFLLIDRKVHRKNYNEGINLYRNMEMYCLSEDGCFGPALANNLCIHRHPPVYTSPLSRWKPLQELCICGDENSCGEIEGYWDYIMKIYDEWDAKELNEKDEEGEEKEKKPIRASKRKK
jgi:hypothetical protein